PAMPRPIPLCAPAPMSSAAAPSVCSPPRSSSASPAAAPPSARATSCAALPIAAVRRRVALAGFGLMLLTHVHGDWLYLRRLDTDHTLLQPRTGPDSPAPPALAARVTIVVLDGL